MFRFFTSLMLIVFSLPTLAQENQTWFNYDEQNDVYSVMGDSIYPGAFFQKVSLYSGIELRYEKSISEGLNLEFEQTNINELIRFIETEFSTLKAYSKNAENQEVLVSLTVLPKGQFQSSELLLALEPIREAIAHKQNSTPSQAQQVYVTRIQSLELKAQKKLAKMTESAMQRQEAQAKREKQRKEKKIAEKQRLAVELKELRRTSPELYERKLEVLAWKYPDLQEPLETPSP